MTKAVLLTAIIFVVLIIAVMIVMLIKLSLGSKSKDSNKNLSKRGKESGTKIKGRKSNKIKDNEEFLLKNDDYPDLLSSKRKDVRNLCAPGGVDTSQLSYIKVNDGGRDLYMCAMYADKLPKRSVFGVTYRELMNFTNCTTSVFIEPLTQAQSVKMLDKRVIALDSELAAAEEDRDRNRYRKISAKLAECEEWAKIVEAGLNVFFKVGFLFSIYADSLERLNDACAQIYAYGKEKGIELVGCYAAQPEAYLASAPFNQMMKVGSGPFKDRIIKYHKMDKNALSDIFNHTESFFSHKNGILAGHNMHTGQPVLIDPYDKSHSGYNACISGITGVGKSAGIKMWLSRLTEVDNYRTAIIDIDSSNGTDGEYVEYVRAEGGVVFQLKHGTKNVLNIFDIDSEVEFVMSTKTEVVKLNLMEKIADCTNILLSMIKGGKEVDKFELDVYLSKIVRETVVEIYEAHGIREGEPQSLFEEGENLVDGKLVSGLVRKKMPTIHEFYIRLLHRKRVNTDSEQTAAYSIAIAGIEPYVAKAFYSESSIAEYDEENYNALPVDENGLKYAVISGNRERVYSVRGVKPYFDGQSTISLNQTTQCMDIDLSQLPKADIDIAQQVACNCINEYFIKKNSNNPRKLQKCIVLVDECHRMFKYPNAIKFIESMYRQGRKRYVSIFTITQAFADYNVCKETQAIAKNSAMKILYKQARMDTSFVREVTPLTESQLDAVMSLSGSADANGEYDNSRKGECCIIDNDDTVVFLKVDYLRSEARICETDPEKRAAMLGTMSA